MTPELETAFNGLALAALTAATGGVVAAGIAAVGHIRASSALRDKQQELAQLEVDDKIRARRKAAALDAAAIAQETSYGGAEPLSGPAKAELAGDKLRELAPDLAHADRSQVQDLVKIGVSQLRTQTSASYASLPGTTYLLTPSEAPPPDVVRQALSDEGRATLPPPNARARDVARTKGPK